MTLTAGTRIARYRLVEKIGEGGMGVVWRARDTRLDRDVVVKVLPPHLVDDRERLQRLEVEAKTIASLNHPNIVTLYSVEEQDGVPFLTMELIEGKQLSEIVPQDGLPLGRFFDIAIALTDAVAAAHERGVTHRDLKPANVMVTDEGRVKVLDFGLAKLAERDEDRDPAERSTEGLTEAGQILGTVRYMSPEQVRGEPVDSRSDIFSLGIVLYEMATGVRPFDGDSSAEVISALLRDTPTAVTELRPELPGHLGRILRACLEKAPDRRYQSCKDLRNALEDLKIEVSTGSFRAPAHRLPRRTRRRWAATGIVATIGLALGAILWLGVDRSPSTAADPAGPSVAVLPFENLSPDADNAYFAEGMTEELINTLVRIPELRVPARTTVAAYRDRDVPAEAVGRELGVHAVLQGSVRKADNRLRVTANLVDASNGFSLWSETFDRELEDVFAIQEEISRAIADKLKVRLVPRPGAPPAAPTRNIEAYNLYLQGRFLWNQRTEDGLRQAIDRFERAIAEDPRFALAHAGLADAWAVLPGYSSVPGDEAFPRAREAALRALELDPNLAEAHTSLAMVLWAFDEDAAAAEREYRRAIELNPDYATAHHWLALLLEVNPESRSEALQHLRRAEELDPLSRIIKLALSQQLIWNGDIDGGIAKVEELRRLDPDYPAHDMAAWAYLTRQRTDDAIEVLEERLRRGMNVKTASYLASLYHVVGRYDDEIVLADRTGAADADFAGTPMFRIRANAARGAATSEISAMVDAMLARAEPPGPLGLYDVAAELELHGHPAIGRRVAEAALARPPRDEGSEDGQKKDPWAAFGMAMCALHVDRPDEASLWVARGTKVLQSMKAEMKVKGEIEAAGIPGLIAAARGDADGVAAAIAALDRLRRPGDLGMPAFWQANVLAAAGDAEAALERLDTAIDDGFNEPGSLHASPLHRKLAGDERLEIRLRRCGLRGTTAT